MTDEPVWYAGRETIIEAFAPALHGPDAVKFRNVPVRVNMQQALASYIRAPGETVFRGFALAVLRVEEGKIAEVSVFHPDLLPTFGLPETS